MAIVITSVPDNQVLNETFEATSYLSVFATGLDLDSDVPVTAEPCGGTQAPYFFEPPDVISVTPSGDQFLVILEFTGAVESDEEGFSVISGELDDAELTVTICQGYDNCSNTKSVVANILSPGSGP